jgi:hypothetical protein
MTRSSERYGEVTHLWCEHTVPIDGPCKSRVVALWYLEETVITHCRTLFIRSCLRSPSAGYVQVIRPFVDRCSNGLPFAHNKLHGSRRYRAVHGDIAGLYEHSDGGVEGQHRRQCRRSPQIRERQRWIAKAQRTASFQHTLPALP